MLKVILVPINREGWPFIAIFAILTLALMAGAYALDWTSAVQPIAWIGGILTVWCICFFRDPHRVTPTRDGLVICPADGVVQLIDRAAPPAELGMGDAERTRVCVFMNVFNVHVNRSPLDGVVKKVAYRPGKFLNASLDKASVDNERMSLSLETKNGTEIAFVQIAGLVARRIVCWTKEGDELKAGERFGMIRFGSRVDVYLPEGVEPMVCLGQTTKAAETVLADLNTTEAVRVGEVR